MRPIGSIILTAIAATICSPAFCQPWPAPVRFVATNAADSLHWGVIANFYGQISSDGKAIEVSIEKAALSGSEEIRKPITVVQLDVSLTRGGGPGGQWERLKLSAPKAVGKTLGPGESVELDPFRLRIPLDDITPIKGDYLTFQLLAGGLIPIQMRAPLPFSPIAVPYCADQVTPFSAATGGVRAMQVIGFCQDSAGSTRRARYYRTGDGTPDILTSIEIFDAKDNVSWRLDPREKTAYRSKGNGMILGGVIGGLPSFAPPPPPPPGSAGEAPVRVPVVTNKWLGKRKFEGVEASGSMTTTVYPRGYQGADREITVTFESWYSYVLRTIVRTQTIDPRNNGNEFYLEKINRGPVDPALFQVPADYRVIEQ